MGSNRPAWLRRTKLYHGPGGAQQEKRPGFPSWSAACTVGPRTLRKAGDWEKTLSLAESDREMKATLLLVVLVILGVAVLVGEPAAFAAGLTSATWHANLLTVPAGRARAGATLRVAREVVHRV